MKRTCTPSGLKPEVIVERTCRVTLVLDGHEAAWLGALIGSVDVKYNAHAKFLHDLYAELLMKLDVENVPPFYERFEIVKHETGKLYVSARPDSKT